MQPRLASKCDPLALAFWVLYDRNMSPIIPGSVQNTDMLPNIRAPILYLSIILSKTHLNIKIICKTKIVF